MKLKICFFFYCILIPAVLAQTENAPHVEINAVAPSFFLKTLTETDFYLSDYCGQPRQPWKKDKRWNVIISFFATYCLPCLKEIPQLQGLAEEWKEDTLFFLIDEKENKNRVSEFAEKNQLKMPILLDRFGVIGEKYNVKSIPSLFYISKEGRIIHIQRGFSAQVVHDLRQIQAQRKEKNPSK